MSRFIYFSSCYYCYFLSFLYFLFFLFFEVYQCLVIFSFPSLSASFFFCVASDSIYFTYSKIIVFFLLFFFLFFFYINCVCLCCGCTVTAGLCFRYPTQHNYNSRCFFQMNTGIYYVYFFLFFLIKKNK